MPLSVTSGAVIQVCCVSLCLQGDRETFENYYRKQRKKQARLVLQPQANMVSKDEQNIVDKLVDKAVLTDHSGCYLLPIFLKFTEGLIHIKQSVKFHFRLKVTMFRI